LGDLDLKDYKVATKVWPTATGAHNSENLKKTFRESLVALKADKVDIFYLHAPDYSTPFEGTIQAVDELYREGRFDRVHTSHGSLWDKGEIAQYTTTTLDSPKGRSSLSFLLGRQPF
jgi:aflatoxin B1 aldehyde reductase